MEVKTTPLPGVVVIEPQVHGDSRGFFLESYHAERYQTNGVPVTFVQDNHSRSGRGVLRGLHYQLRRPQGKLVQVVKGEVFDVAVDIRRGSPTFGQWYGTILSEDNHRQMFVPPDFAHGFVVLSEVADFLYKCTDYYVPDDQWGIAWDDPDLGVEWPVQDLEVILSDKDRQSPKLADCGDEALPSYPEDA